VRPRFQFSIRALLLVTLATALLLVPVAWVSRERQQMLRAQNSILEARELALRSAVLEEHRRVRQARDLTLDGEPGALQRLQDENTSLKRQIDELRSEVERLRNSSISTGTAGR
jgi:hypothetical protein